MKKLISDIGSTRTATVYYLPWKFESYEIIEYSNGKERWKTDNRFIVGKGKPTISREPQNIALTYEWEKDICFSSDDSSFLQYVLTLGRKLLKENGNRCSNFGKREIDFALKFTEKYGLFADQLFNLHMNDGNPAPHPHGCSLWVLLQTVQSIYIAFEAMNKTLNSPSNLDEINLVQAAKCSAVLTSDCAYSSVQKRFVTFLSAYSLLDIAWYQLGVVMSAGVYVRKCANPECCEMIIGGRKDKKTCSDTCRQALKRFMEGSRNSGNDSEAGQ